VKRLKEPFKILHRTFSSIFHLANSATQFCSDRQTLAWKLNWLGEFVWMITLFHCQSVAEEILSQFDCQAEKKSEQHLYKAAVIVCHTVDNYRLLLWERKYIHFSPVSIPRTQWIWDTVAMLFWVTLKYGVRSIQWHNRQSNTKSVSAIHRHAVQTHPLFLCLLGYAMQAKRKKYLSSLHCSRRNQFIFLRLLTKQVSRFFWI